MYKGRILPDIMPIGNPIKSHEDLAHLHISDILVSALYDYK